MALNFVPNAVFWRSLGLRKALSLCSRSTTTLVVANYAEQKEKLLAQLKEELPKPYDGPERDLVNFPRMPRPIYPGKVRMGVFPDEWFTFFYKKTGVTGPYVFGTGLITFLLSKELYVIEDEFSTGCALLFLIWISIKKFGPGARAWAERLQAEEEGRLNNSKAANMKNLEKSIALEKKMQWQSDINNILISAKRENVMMQLETEYRRRLMNVYEQVKKRLDYHLDIDNTRRKLEQKHMVEWIVSNVIKSITPTQEKDALKKCVEDLKLLATQAK